MDLSKLPKLSNTQPAADRSPDGPDASASVPPAIRPAPPQFAFGGAEAWISIAVGVILLLMSPRLLQYVSSQLFGTQFTWTFSDHTGQPISYTQSVYLWGDLALTLFALVLIVEGILLAWVRRPAVVLAAMVLTILVTLFNLIYLVMMLPNYGLQIMSAFAVAFGVYIALHQWRMAQTLRAAAL
jgi:hypothetical protein